MLTGSDEISAKIHYVFGPNEIETTSAGSGMLVTWPDPPSNVRVEGRTLDTLSLSWDPPIFSGGSELISYTIKYDEMLLPSETNHFTLRDLEPGQNYLFTVKAANKFLESQFSDAYPIEAGFVPAAPVQFDWFEFNTDINEVKFNWTKPYNGGAEIQDYLLTMTSNGQ